MKRIIAALAASAAILGGGAALAAAAVGVPEVDVASANIQLQPLGFRAVPCAGEDATNYVTYFGTWKGGQNDTSGLTDYTPMSGPLTIKSVVWTINLSTARGVLHGTAVLTSASGAGVIYSGPMTLITQGLPDSAGNGVQARGWIEAPTYTNGAKDGGSVLANVELQITPGLVANGQFGSPTLGFQDFSVATNNLVC